MSFQASQGYASRLGYALGKGVRYFLQDRNPALRWIKRTGIFILAAALLAQVVSWLAGVALSIGCVGLIVWALSKAEVTSNHGPYAPDQEDDEDLVLQSQDEGMWRDGPEGWGYYRVDDVRLDF